MWKHEHTKIKEVLFWMKIQRNLSVNLQTRGRNVAQSWIMSYWIKSAWGSSYIQINSYYHLMKMLFFVSWPSFGLWCKCWMCFIKLLEGIRSKAFFTTRKNNFHIRTVLLTFGKAIIMDFLYISYSFCSSYI